MFCYICKTKNPEVTHHIFPKNVDLRCKWLAACGLKETDLLKYTRKYLIDADGHEIKWQHLENLVNLQNEEGLLLANKLKKRHINWQSEKMNVRLAAQTLSNSVADSLIYCEMKGDFFTFEGATHTANFCKIINNSFDILNSRNIFSKNLFNKKICAGNVEKTLEIVKTYIKYISNLKTLDGRLLIESERKIGFLGLVICLQNSIELYQLLSCKTKKFKYLLTYKLSQDHLEVFFSAVRSRGGYNNNPSAYQFRNAYRRLLGRHQISGSYIGNCIDFEGVEILHVGSGKIKSLPDSLIEETEPDTAIAQLDHDYLDSIWELSPIVEDIVVYISGFICKSIKRKIHCQFCRNLLIGDENSPLISIKNRGKLIMPSKDVTIVCKTTEREYRSIENNLNEKKIMCLKNKIFQMLNTKVFQNEAIFIHINTQDMLHNHRTELIKIIINMYCNTRIHYTNKKLCEKENYIRRKYTKLVTYKNQ